VLRRPAWPTACVMGGFGQRVIGVWCPGSRGILAQALHGTELVLSAACTRPYLSSHGSMSRLCQSLTPSLIRLGSAFPSAATNGNATVPAEFHPSARFYRLNRLLRRALVDLPLRCDDDSPRDIGAHWTLDGVAAR
jgi:hypothetical protein